MMRANALRLLKIEDRSREAARVQYVVSDCPWGDDNSDPPLDHEQDCLISTAEWEREHCR